MRLIARIAAGLAAALLATAGLVPASAVAAPALADTSCAGVWVVVAGQGTACATAHGTGKQALQSAGFTVRDKTPGFLCQINGSPSTCVITVDAYWSYWHASRNADGTWGPWTYAQLGYTNRKPKQGDAEGWAFGNGSQRPPSPPTVKAKPSEPTQPPTQTKPTTPSRPNTQAPAPQPPSGGSSGTSNRAAQAPAPGTKAPDAPRPQASASTGAEPSAPVAEASATPEPSAEPIDEATPSPEPGPETSAAPAAEPTLATQDGGPTGVLVTVGVLVAGGAALGGWWFVKRRGA
ncbi:MAG: hypothetical protein QM708_03915 [Propioniciclava sp.]|uniref:hypothetical protein n=1 Tax=Propioniciclava sp. TaxID=2038686 RepID=UPI0039E68845